MDAKYVYIIIQLCKAVRPGEGKYTDMLTEVIIITIVIVTVIIIINISEHFYM